MANGFIRVRPDHLWKDIYIHVRMIKAVVPLDFWDRACVGSAIYMDVDEDGVFSTNRLEVKESPHEVMKLIEEAEK